MTDPAPTDEQVAEWVALADAATPEPWRVYVSAATLNVLTADNAVVAYVGDFGADLHKRGGDAAFIAAARTAVPALAAALSSARAENERLQGLMLRQTQLNTEVIMEKIDAQTERDQARAERDALHESLNVTAERAAGERRALDAIREVRSCLGAGPMDYEAFVDEVDAILGSDGSGDSRAPDRTHADEHPLSSVPGCGKRQATAEGRDGATP